MRLFQMPLITPQTMLHLNAATGAFAGSCCIQSTVSLADLDAVDSFALATRASTRWNQELGLEPVQVSGGLLLPKGTVRLSSEQAAQPLPTQFRTNPIQLLLEEHGSRFSPQAKKLLNGLKDKLRLEDSVRLERLFHLLSLFKQGKYQAVLRPHLEADLKAFGLTPYKSDTVLKIVTIKELETKTVIKTYFATYETALATPLLEQPSNGFDKFIIKALEAARTATLDAFGAAFLYDVEGKLIEPNACYIFWKTLSKYLTPKQMGCMLQGLKSPYDVASFIASVYSLNKYDELLEIKLIQLLDVFPEPDDVTNEEMSIDSVLAILLDDEAYMPVGVGMMIDFQLYGGTRRSMRAERVYERLQSGYDYWYPNLVDVLTMARTYPGFEEAENADTSLQANDNVSLFLGALAKIRKPEGVFGNCADAFEVLREIANKKDCPYELKERIAGIFLEIQFSGKMRDQVARSIAKKGLNDLRHSLYGEMEDTVNFYLGSTKTEQALINMAKWSRNKTSLKEMIARREHYSLDALKAYLEIDSDLREVDFIGLPLGDFEFMVPDGVRVTANQIVYMTQNAKKLEVENSGVIYVEGAKDEHIEKLEGNLHRLYFDYPNELSAKAVVNVLDRLGVVSSDFREYRPPQSFTAEQIEKLVWHYKRYGKQYVIDLLKETTDEGTFLSLVREFLPDIKPEKIADNRTAHLYQLLASQIRIRTWCVETIKKVAEGKTDDEILGFYLILVSDKEQPRPVIKYALDEMAKMELSDDVLDSLKQLYEREVNVDYMNSLEGEAYADYRKMILRAYIKACRENAERIEDILDTHGDSDDVWLSVVKDHQQIGLSISVLETIAKNHRNISIKIKATKVWAKRLYDSVETESDVKKRNQAIQKLKESVLPHIMQRLQILNGYSHDNKIMLIETLRRLLEELAKYDSKAFYQPEQTYLAMWQDIDKCFMYETNHNVLLNLCLLYELSYNPSEVFLDALREKIDLTKLPQKTRIQIINLIRKTKPAFSSTLRSLTAILVKYKEQRDIQIAVYQALSQAVSPLLSQQQNYHVISLIVGDLNLDRFIELDSELRLLIQKILAQIIKYADDDWVRSQTVNFIKNIGGRVYPIIKSDRYLVVWPKSSPQGE